MYEEREAVILPFAVDRKDAAVQCAVYFGIFSGLAAVLIALMTSRGYDPGKFSLIMGIYALITLVTWVPMALRCASRLHLETEGLRVSVFGLTLRRYPLGKIRFLTALESTGKNGSRQAQILLSAYTFEELAKKGGWKYGDRKPAEECARQYLNRFAGAYYVRELNLSGRFFFLDWSPERIRLIRWFYPDARWADFSHNRIFDKQMND